MSSGEASDEASAATASVTQETVPTSWGGDKGSAEMPVEQTAESPEQLESARLKDEGNNAYRAQDYPMAVKYFTHALAIVHSADFPHPNHIILTNRAMCHAATKDWGSCVHDGEAAIRINGKHAKAYYWLVRGLTALNRIRDARQHLLVAYKECPNNDNSSGTGNKSYKELEKELNEAAGTPLRPKPSDFDILDTLGEGNFSKIYHAHLKLAKKNAMGLVVSSGACAVETQTDADDGRDLASGGSANGEYAIKVIEVQTVDRMKRRHRNIHNEILMEKRALSRLQHPGIVQLYATFKDYGSLYYQMEFMVGGELWSQLQEHDDSGDGDGTFGLSNAVGMPVSMARRVVAEAVNALQYMHNKGIVHRDIKPENMLFTADGHMKFVDFGTAKDLIQTDLNGPEFVGTPDYMSPSTVGSKAVGPEADLWALGIVLYQMLTGYTPFSAPSPYLSFLRTKRAALREPDFVSANCVELLRKLLTKEPAARLAGCCSQQSGGPISYDAIRRLPFFAEDKLNFNGSNAAGGDFVKALQSIHTEPAVRVPTLAELSRRAVGRACVRAATVIAEHGGVKPNIADFPELAWVKMFSLVVAAVPAGSDSEKKDQGCPYPASITQQDRQYILHYLNRRQQITTPGLYRLFWKSVIDTKCIRTDNTSREYLGFNRNTQGIWRSSGIDPSKDRSGPQGKDKGQTGVLSDFLFAHIGPQGLTAGTDEASLWRAESLKKLITSVNRLRPKFAVVTGSFTAAADDGTCNSSTGTTVSQHQLSFTTEREVFRKAIARVSDSIPLLFVPGPTEMGLVHKAAGDGDDDRLPSRGAIERYQKHFGLDFYGFWFNGIRYLIVNSSLFFCSDQRTALTAQHGAGNAEYVLNHVSKQANWLAEEIDQAKLCSTQLYVLTAHPWFIQNMQEEDGSYCASVNAGASAVIAIPKKARMKWIRRLQHHRATLVLSGASGCTEYGKVPKTFCFPDAPVASVLRKAARKEEKRARKAKSRGRIRAGAEAGDGGDDEAEAGDCKRLDNRKTPSKSASTSSSSADDDCEGLLPSQIIAKARASGEVPPDPAAPSLSESDARVVELGVEEDDSSYVCRTADDAAAADAGASPTPPAPPTGSDGEPNPNDYSDTDSDRDSDSGSDGDRDNSDDDTESDTDGDDGDEQAAPPGAGGNEPRFRNVDRAIEGPETVCTHGLGGSGSANADEAGTSACIRLVRVSEDGFKHGLFPAEEVSPTSI